MNDLLSVTLSFPLEVLVGTKDGLCQRIDVSSLVLRSFSCHQDDSTSPSLVLSSVHLTVLRHLDPWSSLGESSSWRLQKHLPITSTQELSPESTCVHPSLVCHERSVTDDVPTLVLSLWSSTHPYLLWLPDQNGFTFLIQSWNFCGDP